MGNLYVEISQFIKRPFIKGLAVLEIGNILNIAIMAVASIVVARFLGPSDYGLYSIAFAAAGIFTLFLNFGQNTTALTIGAEKHFKKDGKALEEVFGYLAKLSFVLSIIVILGFALGSTLGIFYDNPTINYLIFVIILTAIISLIPHFASMAFQISEKFKVMTILESVGKALRGTIGIILAVLGFGVVAIISGYLLAAVISSIAAVSLFKNISSKDALLPGIKTIVSSAREVEIKKYFKFGFLIALDKNISKLFPLLPVIFLGKLVGPDQAAFFRIALLYISLPIMLLDPLTRLLTTQLPKTASIGLTSLKKNFIKTTLVSLFTIIILAVPLLLLAPFLIELLYGQSYTPSIKYIYLLTGYVITIGASIGLGPLTVTLNKVKTSILINFVVLAVGSLTGWFLVKNYGITGAVIMITGLYAGATLFLYIYMARHLSGLIKTRFKQ